MKEFLLLILTKLGLGKNAHVSSVVGITGSLHECFGDEFNTEIVNDTTIKVSYSNTVFYLVYTFSPIVNVTDEDTKNGLTSIVTNLVITENI